MKTIERIALIWFVVRKRPAAKAAGLVVGEMGADWRPSFIAMRLMTRRENSSASTFALVS